MLPGEVYYFSANSFVLCVNRTREKKATEKKKVITPKTPTLNPNADVFHSLSPPVAAMPPDHLSSVSSSSSSWTNAETAVQPPSNSVPSNTNLPGNSHLGVNGVDLATQEGVVQMAIVYPALPSTLVSPSAGSEYAPVAMNGGCPIQDAETAAAAQALFASGSDTRTSTDEVGPLEDFVEPGQLRMMLKRQLEYYFSRENLASDTYLVSQMDADQFVLITTVASFNQVKRLTRNIDLVIEVLRESGNVQVDETGEKVRPLHKRCIVILREIPDSTPIEEVEKLFASDSCPPFISCQFAHNSSWYVTFDTEEDAQRAYRYLREEVKTFLGMPIMARIKAKPLLRSSYLTKEASADYSPNIYQQPKFSYTSPVPSIQYIPPQNLPFFTPHANMSPVWSTSVVYYDPGMAFAANGYIPTATFTPPSPHPAPNPSQQCSPGGQELQSPRTRTAKPRFGRLGSLDHGDMAELDYQYRRSWHHPSTRLPDDEYHSSYDPKRAPRYASTGGPSRTPGSRSEFFRGGTANRAPPMSPRTGAEHRGSGGRHQTGVARSSYSSDNEVFHYGSATGNQSSQTMELKTEGAAEAGGSSSEATVVQGARDSSVMGLPPRSGGSYKSRRRSRPSLGETSKSSMLGVQPTGTASFELQEKSFPPLPGSHKLSVPPQSDRLDGRVASDVVRGTFATAEASKGNHQPLLNNGTSPLSVAAVVRVSFADDVPTSASANASLLSLSSSVSGKESVAAVAGNTVADACPTVEQESSHQSKENRDEVIDKRVVPEAAGTTHSTPDTSTSSSTCSAVSSLSNQPSFESPASIDDSCNKSSQKLSYAQMALRGKERQGSRPSSKLSASDTESTSPAATSCLESTVTPSVPHRAEDSPVRRTRNGAVHRSTDWPENGCRALRGHEVRKCETVPAWN